MDDGIIGQLSSQGVWEEFLSWRLVKGRFNWTEFDEADLYVERKEFLPLAEHLSGGGRLGLPHRTTINKMGSSKKRVVYSFDPQEMTVLKLIAHLLYRYDGVFCPNCYAFRRGLRATDALLRLNRLTRDKQLWAYKLDIHNYFNSIPIPKLLPMLQGVLADDPLLYSFFETLLSDDRVLSGEEVICESHGIMAGTPTSPFLANVYLSGVDRYFMEAGAIYARYSDDIIIFAPDQKTLEGYKSKLLGFLKELELEVNHDKERTYSPAEAYEFLGFKCKGRSIDISDAALTKLKGKIRRKAKSLLRWKERKGMSSEQAMLSMIRHFNRKFFEGAEDGSLTWSRWFFPVITATDGLREIDSYLQENIRFLSTGRHGKANYRIRYDTLKSLGYRSLVHEYYLFREGRTEEGAFK